MLDVCWKVIKGFHQHLGKLLSVFFSVEGNWELWFCLHLIEEWANHFSSLDLSFLIHKTRVRDEVISRNSLVPQHPNWIQVSWSGGNDLQVNTSRRTFRKKVILDAQGGLFFGQQPVYNRKLIFHMCSNIRYLGVDTYQSWFKRSLHLLWKG